MTPLGGPVEPDVKSTIAKSSHVRFRKGIEIGLCELSDKDSVVTGETAVLSLKSLALVSKAKGGHSSYILFRRADSIVTGSGMTTQSASNVP
jgi:hypothetical protein